MKYRTSEKGKWWRYCNYQIKITAKRKRAIEYIYRAWNLFYEHPYCTDSDMFHLLLTNVLIVSRFG